MNKNILLRIEEIILLGLIVLNLAEYMGLLNSDFGYIKKVISYTILGVLLYRSSLSSVFYGNKNQNFDFLIVLAYFLLAFKNVFIVSISSIETSIYFKPFFYLLTVNGPLFEIITFYLGLLILLVLASWTALKFKIMHPSMFAVLHESNKETSWKKIITNYLVFLTFFLFIFNLAFEWLAISIDAPIISIAFFVYLFIAWRKKSLDTESLLFKIGNYGEQFYEQFINHFKQKEKFFLGIAGMLILHMITDIGVYIIPYLTGLRNELYSPIFTNNHQTILVLIQSLNLNFTTAIALFVQYLFATIGYVLLMIIPVITWHNLYFRKQMRVNAYILAGVISGLSAFALTPIYSIKPLDSGFFSGVDVLTKAVYFNPFVGLVIVIIAFLIGLLFAKKYHKLVSHTINILATGFFLFYILNYFISVLDWYRIASFNLLQTSHWLIGLHFFFFLMLTIIFYIGGFYFYVRSLIKHRVTI